MKHPRVSVILLLLLSFGLERVIAQETITTTGGNASGDGGTSAYTIGQASYLPYTTASGILLQGVQIPYEISVVLGFNNKNIDLNVAAYPNPTQDFLTISLKKPLENGARFLLFNVNGTLVRTGTLSEKDTHIRIQPLPPSEYFLKIVSEEHELKSFKIIKK